MFLLSDLAEPRRYKISGDMTFGQLIAEACETEQLSLELLNNWYLVDRNKGLCYVTCVHNYTVQYSPIPPQGCVDLVGFFCCS